jgi:hypothetical protein
MMKRYPDVRDNWQYILAMLWKEQIGDEGCKKSAFVFLGELANKKLYSPETVVRVWRKILEEIPELRGPGYAKRHKTKPSEYKQAIREIKEEIQKQGKLNL